MNFTVLVDSCQQAAGSAVENCQTASVVLPHAWLSAEALTMVPWPCLCIVKQVVSRLSTAAARWFWCCDSRGSSPSLQTESSRHPNRPGQTWPPESLQHRAFVQSVKVMPCPSYCCAGAQQAAAPVEACHSDKVGSNVQCNYQLNQSGAEASPWLVQCHCSLPRLQKL